MATIGKIGIWRVAGGVGAAVWIGLFTGCPPTIPPFDPGTVKAGKLPRNVPKLVAFAKQRLALGRAKGFHRLYHTDALVALDKARSIDPKNREVLRLGAEVSRRLGSAPGAVPSSSSTLSWGSGSPARAGRLFRSRWPSTTITPR